jgi:hypothetical protein
MNKMSTVLGATAIIIVAAVVLVGASVLVLEPTANAQVRLHHSCTDNPGYAHGEPAHKCPALKRAA